MKTPHLAPALTALVLVAAILLGGVFYARAMERRYVHALAPQLLDLNLQGVALQKEALQQPDLLLVYGSSELANRPTEYSAAQFFSAYPTGFAPFQVAKAGMASLTMAQDVAAVGTDLKGKKVVISFAPTMFYKDMVDTYEYAGLFSRLHANELAFSAELSFATKQAAAKRMLEYPETLEKEPLLHFALKRLADDSLLNRVLYYMAWPLGKLWTMVLELQDHWETLTAIWVQPGLSPEVPRQPAVMDWPAIEAQAEREQIPYSSNNPYGFDNRVWEQHSKKLTQQKFVGVERNVIAELQHSAEWTDLDILLRVLTELGAQPLIITRPIHAIYWESTGLSAQVRQPYYDRLRALAAGYGVTVVDFQEYEYDKYFNIDPDSHTSRKGWVHVNKTMDDFYHGTLR